MKFGRTNVGPSCVRVLLLGCPYLNGGGDVSAAIDCQILYRAELNYSDINDDIRGWDEIILWNGIKI